VRTIVVGLGNPILCDDAVGIKAARMVKEHLGDLAGLEVTEAYAGGLRLMEAIAGYDRAVIVDAMKSGSAPPGTLARLRPGGVATTRNLLCTHDGDLDSSLRLGRELGLDLPREIEIIGIEADDVETFSEELTGAVQAALPAAVARLVAICRSSAWTEPAAKELDQSGVNR